MPSSFQSSNRFHILNENEEWRDVKEEVMTELKTKAAKTKREATCGTKQKRNPANKKASLVSQSTWERDTISSAADGDDTVHLEDRLLKTKHDGDTILPEGMLTETEQSKHSGDLSTIVEESENETPTPVKKQEVEAIKVIIYESGI